jgi:hypothetical protein
LSLQCCLYYFCQPELTDFVEHKNSGTRGWEGYMDVDSSQLADRRQMALRLEE